MLYINNIFRGVYMLGYYYFSLNTFFKKYISYLNYVS